MAHIGAAGAATAAAATAALDVNFYVHLIFLGVNIVRNGASFCSLL